MISRKAEALFLFFGDLILFYVALFFMLLVRYGVSIKWPMVYLHLLPFSILFLIWFIIFFIAGLYERHTILFQKRLPIVLFYTLVINSVIAVFLFYFIPSFLITPRINLFIYLFVAFSLLFLWRWYGQASFGSSSRSRAVLIGSGEEAKEIKEEVNGNSRYNLQFVAYLDPNGIAQSSIESEIKKIIDSAEATIIVADFQSRAIAPILPRLYDLFLARIGFVSLHNLYEEIFGRIPLSLLEQRWFLEYAGSPSDKAYDLVKRIMDIALAIPLLFFSLLLFPFVVLAIKIEDKGDIFIKQKRVGKDNKFIEIIKFRTMRFNDGGLWKKEGNGNHVTKVGSFLRASRIDELPALWNVLRGDLSLIGPRPEFEEAVAHYEKEVPFYSARHMIKPGLSGLAQLYGEHPHHSTDIIKTKNKLSYDLYYLKNRSFLLDLKIALKTIKVILSHSGV